MRDERQPSSILRQKYRLKGTKMKRVRRIHAPPAATHGYLPPVLGPYRRVAEGDRDSPRGFLKPL